jgi:glycosyltransferase involved in cell wall biosynthesis
MTLRFLIMSLLRPREALRIARSVLASGGVVAARAIAERSTRWKGLVYMGMLLLGRLGTSVGLTGGLVYTIAALVGTGKRVNARALLHQSIDRPSIEERAAAAVAAAFVGERTLWSQLVNTAGFSQPANSAQIEASTSQTLAHIATSSIYAGELSEGARLLKSLLERPKLSRSMRSVMTRRLSDVEKRIWQYSSTWLPNLPPVRVRPLGADKTLVTTLWKESLPEVQSGYTLRSQSIAEGMQRAGLTVQSVTASGFPIGGPSYAHPNRRQLGSLMQWRIGGSKFDSTESDSVTATGLAQVIDDSGSGIIISTTPYHMAATALAVARSRGIKMIYEVRGFIEETWLSRAGAGADSSEYYQIWRAAETRTMKAADAVVTLSDGMRDEIINRGVPGDRVFVIPNGVDVTRFTPRQRDTSLAKKLGISEDTPVIGYIGSFVSYEGLSDLVRACSFLRDQGVLFKLLLVGSGADSAQVDSVVSELRLEQNVVRTGRVHHQETPSYHSLIDIFAVPRTGDRVCQLVTPLKPYEAMAMGRCVVASNVAAIRQVVRNGETGRLADPNNPNDLARVLRELIEDPEQRLALGENARKWVQSERNWVAIGGLYSSVIRHVVSK